MKHLVALSALALLAFGLIGCTSTEPEPPAPEPSATQPSATQPSAVPEPEVSSTRYGYVTLHTTEFRSLLTEARPSDGGRAVAWSGALAVNEHGCFGLGNGIEGFSPVVFPHGTEITDDGPDAGIEFGDAHFRIGDVIELGAGGAYIDEQGEWVTDWLEVSREGLDACGSSGDVLVTRGVVHLLADLERENAEHFGE